MKKNKAIAILGGMGSEASVYMYKTLIDLSISKFGAKNNDQFPEIILHSIPVPDFISSDKDQQKALAMLRKKVKDLNKLDISNLAIACNTAHILLSALQKISRVSFVSMIDEVAAQVKSDGLRKIGVLGTPSTLGSGLYQQVLEIKDIKCLLPTKTQTKTLERIIRNVIAGKLLKSDTKKLRRIANSLTKKGAEGIILGCTELPLVFPKKYDVSVYNSVEILALALLRKYYKQNTIGANL